jgi:hypothetical protein
LPPSPSSAAKELSASLKDLQLAVTAMGLHRIRYHLATF